MDVGNIAATHPADGVDGVDGVVEHVVAGTEEGVGFTLEEFADGVVDGSSLEAEVAHFDEEGAGAALVADLGDAVVLLGKVGEGEGLVEVESEWFFDEEVQALVEAPDPGVDHDVGVANGVDGVGVYFFDHFLVAGGVLGPEAVFGGDVETLGGGVELVGVEGADAGDFDIVEGGQAGVVDFVGHLACADDYNA